MFSRNEYDHIDEIALRLRIDYGFLNSYLDVFDLAKQMNVSIVKYSSLNEEQMRYLSRNDELGDGFTIMREKENNYDFRIFYNDLADSCRIRFTIAHEIKHIVFIERNPTPDQEKMADHFARILLAPTCMVLRAARFNCYSISKEFGLSFEAACNAYSSAKNRIMFFGESFLTNYEREFIKHVDAHEAKRCGFEAGQ